MNQNTFAAYFGGTGRGQLASQTLASTTETEIHVNTNASSAIAVLNIPLQTSVIGSQSPFGVDENAALIGTPSYLRNRTRPYFSTSSFEGRPFLLRLSGVATPASNAGNSLLFKLYQGASKAGEAICSTGAVPEASTTAARAFIVEAQLIWSVSSGKLDGQFWFFVAGTSGTVYTTWAAATQTSAAAVSDLQFCAATTWGNAVGGVVAASEFSLSQL